PAPALDVRTSGPVEVVVENPFFQALAGFGVFGRRPLLRNAAGQLVVETEVNAVRIGPARIAATPHELDPQLGEVYRARMGAAEHRWVLGLANDEIGYQMPREQFNPACLACAVYILRQGSPDACPLALELGGDVVDCSTVFINDIGPGADPLLSGLLGDLLDELD